mmetsp:Transcript_7201/g.18669  ORF Transcript_7201/g.18669 Transcript_7201/m.18669 type:complete len:219 (+) Transcript_7201:23-679(+)
MARCADCRLGATAGHHEPCRHTLLIPSANLLAHSAACPMAPDGHCSFQELGDKDQSRLSGSPGPSRCVPRSLSYCGTVQIAPSPTKSGFVGLPSRVDGTRNRTRDQEVSVARSDQLLGNPPRRFPLLRRLASGTRARRPAVPLSCPLSPDAPCSQERVRRHPADSCRRGRQAGPSPAAAESPRAGRWGTTAGRSSSPWSSTSCAAGCISDGCMRLQSD